MCLGKKMGYVNSEGIIDKNKMEQNCRSILRGVEGIADVIVKKCIIGSPAFYGNSQDCELKKIRFCGLACMTAVKCLFY